MANTIATALLLDMVEAVQAKDAQRLFELLNKRMIIVNCIEDDVYLAQRYIAVLTAALEMLMEGSDRLQDRLTELDEMITVEQKEEIKRIALQKQLTFEQVIRDAIDAYLLQRQRERIGGHNDAQRGMECPTPQG